MKSGGYVKEPAPDDTDASDEALMIRLANGDAGALRPLVDRYQAPLNAYLYRMLDSDFGAAEDGVQETFLRVIKQRSYRTGLPVRPWLYRIATNVAVDWLRHRRPLPLYEDRRGATQAGPDAAVEQSEQAAGVRRMLQSLPEDSRTVLVLRFYQELSLQEIAETLGVPLRTVKSRLFTAARRVREHMGEEVRP
jgi:RNA polymerase sigma-70 factor, ECF subfamily